MIVPIIVLFLFLPIVSAGSLYSKTIIFFKLRCNVFFNQVDCEDAGCYWYDMYCSSMPSSFGTDMCYKLDEEVTYCTTNINTNYLIIYMGDEIGAIVNI